jgi:uncharacterized protein
MSGERLTYLDSSALVKLVLHETESAALARYLRRKRVTASALARVEVARAIVPSSAAREQRLRALFAGVEVIRVNDRVLAEAARIPPWTLRTLDAIHLATARLWGDELARIVTYDQRMADAARAMGIDVAAPA